MLKCNSLNGYHIIFLGRKIMKKRIFAALAATVFTAAVLGACSAAGDSGQAVTTAAVSSEASEPATAASQSEKQQEKAAVLLTLEDSAQADAAWDGLQRFTEEFGYSGTTASWRGTKTKEKLDEMVKAEAAAGFTTVACYGDEFLPSVLEAATEFPDTAFLFLGSADGDIPENVYVIDWKEEQAGFLAGYAAVCEGVANLGFLGRKDIPESVRYGYGFVQGADAAALELEREIQIRYAYVETADGNPDGKELAGNWFDSGTEVIFAEGEENGNSAIAAAGADGGKVIGSDRDWSGQSPAVLTSVMVNISDSIYEMMKQIDSGEMTGGDKVLSGAGEKGIGLSMETSRFHNFSRAEYEMVLSGLANGDYTPVSDMGKDGKKLELSDLNLTNTEIRVSESKE